MNRKSNNKTVKLKITNKIDFAKKTVDMFSKVNTVLKKVVSKTKSKKETHELIDMALSAPKSESVATLPESTTSKYIPDSSQIMNLPSNYGITRIVLLVRDPNWVYAYWEITDNAKNKVMEITGTDDWKKNKQILRIYEVPSSGQNGDNARRMFDIEIGQYSNNWYIQMPSADRNYIAEIGVLNSNGIFYKIARSNKIYMPRESVSDIIDDKWISAPNYDEIVRLSGGVNPNRYGFGSIFVMEEISRRQVNDLKVQA